MRPIIINDTTPADIETAIVSVCDLSRFDSVTSTGERETRLYPEYISPLFIAGIVSFENVWNSR